MNFRGNFLVRSWEKSSLFLFLEVAYVSYLIVSVFWKRVEGGGR